MQAIVVGGISNTAIGLQSFVGGGQGNSASTTQSAVGGGLNNTASGSNSFVGSGQLNTASGALSVIAGGFTNLASETISFVGGGANAVASHYGQSAHASGMYAANGDAQTSVFVARNTTNNAVATELFLDGTGVRLTIPSGSAYSFRALVTGETSSAASAAGYEIRGIIKNSGGATSIVGAVVQTVLGEDVAAWNATVVADNANDALVVQVTGAAATTIRWVARVETSEVVFP